MRSPRRSLRVAALGQYGSAAAVGIIVASLLFFLLAIFADADYFAQRWLLGACLGIAVPFALIVAHLLWRQEFRRM